MTDQATPTPHQANPATLLLGADLMEGVVIPKTGEQEKLLLIRALLQIAAIGLSRAARAFIPQGGK